MTTIVRAPVTSGRVRIHAAALCRAAGFEAPLRALTSIVATATLVGSLEHSGTSGRCANRSNDGGFQRCPTPLASVQYFRGTPMGVGQEAKRTRAPTREWGPAGHREDPLVNSEGVVKRRHSGAPTAAPRQVHSAAQRRGQSAAPRGVGRVVRPGEPRGAPT